MSNRSYTGAQSLGGIAITFGVVLIVISIRAFLLMPVIIEGDSMNPTLQDGDFKLAKPVEVSPYKPTKNDIVILDKAVLSRSYVSRVVGLPGETIEVNGEQINVGDDQVYVLGDNVKPKDAVGLVDISDIRGVLR